MHNKLVDLLLDCDDNVTLYRYLDNWVSAGELKTQVWEKTHALLDREFLSEQIVALVATDSLEWIATFWALSIIGCQVIILHQSIEKQTIIDMCAEHKISHVITDRQDLANIDTPVHFVHKLISKVTDPVEPFTYTDNHFLVCFLTSGTSNRPKLVMQAEQGIKHSIGLYEQWYKAIDTGPDSLFLSIPKMSWTPGFNINVVSVLMHRVPAVIGFSVTELKKLDVFCKTNPVTHILMSPYVAEMLVQSPMTSLPDSIVSIAVGGEPLPFVVADAFRAKYQKELLAFYGLNEATCISSESGKHKNGSTGRMFDGIEYKVISDTGAVCAPGVAGKLHTKHPGGSMAYLNDPEMSAIVFKDGWVSHNDIVSVDENREVTFYGRANSFIKIKGYWVNMYEVEQSLMEFDVVKTAVVVQDTNRADYNAMVAYIVTHQPVTENLISGMLFAKFKKRFMIPKRMVFVEELPRTASLKKIRSAELIAHKLEQAGHVI